MMYSIGDFPNIVSAIKYLKPSEPIYAVRFHKIEQQVKQFLKLFPGETMYAVKCNQASSVIHTIYRAGVSFFDTASLREIALIKCNFPEARCFFMNPIKSRESIRKAYYCFQVRDFVVDHIDELEKIFQEIGYDIRIFVRFKPIQYSAAFTLSDKFGATPKESVNLLRRISQTSAIPALAFHVGSQCREPKAFYDSILLAREICNDSGVSIRTIDVGGGFPAFYIDNEAPTLERFFHMIREAKIQCGWEDIEFLCEPGRALVAESISVITQVVLRKANTLYLNDGSCHSFYEGPMGGLVYPVRVIRFNGEVSEKLSRFTLFGPTCDNTDILGTAYMLPNNIQSGDWLEIRNAGAYSYSMMSTFNGFTTNRMITVHE